MLHIKQTNVRRLKGGEQTDWPGLCSPSFPLASYIPNWVQESLVSQKYQCVQKEKALTSLLSQLKDQERAASRDRQHKKVSALLQQTTQKTLWPHVHHAAKANSHSCQAVMRCHKLCKMMSEKAGSKDLTRHLTSLCHQWIQCGEPGIPVRGVTRHLPCSLGHCRRRREGRQVGHKEHSPSAANRPREKPGLLLPPGSSKVALPLPLPECYQRKPANRKGLNKI